MAVTTTLPAAADDESPSPSPRTATPATSPASDPAEPIESPPTPPVPATPGPSEPPPSVPPAPVPVLEVSTTPVAGTVHPGDKVTLYVLVHADKAVARRGRLVLSTAPRAVTTPHGRYDLGEVTTTDKTVPVTVTVPQKMKPGKLTLTARVSSAAGDNAEPRTSVRAIKVVSAPKAKTAKTSSAPAAPTLPVTPPGGTAAPGYTPPSPAGSIQPAGVPGIALPQIAAATPSGGTASGGAPSNLSSRTTAMREGSSSPDPQQLTFQRLAGTQAAWLAALLVAFSVLLTQVRLGGGRPPRPRFKGGHRRSRRGLFGA